MGLGSDLGSYRPTVVRGLIAKQSKLHYGSVLASGHPLTDQAVKEVSRKLLQGFAVAGQAAKLVHEQLRL